MSLRRHSHSATKSGMHLRGLVHASSPVTTGILKRARQDSNLQPLDPQSSELYRLASQPPGNTGMRAGMPGIRVHLWPGSWTDSWTVLTRRTGVEPASAGDRSRKARSGAERRLASDSRRAAAVCPKATHAANNFRLVAVPSNSRERSRRSNHPERRIWRGRHTTFKVILPSIRASTSWSQFPAEDGDVASE